MRILNCMFKAVLPRPAAAAAALEERFDNAASVVEPHGGVKFRFFPPLPQSARKNMQNEGHLFFSSTSQHRLFGDHILRPYFLPKCQFRWWRAGGTRKKSVLNTAQMCQRFPRLAFWLMKLFSRICVSVWWLMVIHLVLSKFNVASRIVQTFTFLYQNDCRILFIKSWVQRCCEINEFGAKMANQMERRRELTLGNDGSMPSAFVISHALMEKGKTKRASSLGNVA